jgi:hypothetical protein
MIGDLRTLVAWIRRQAEGRDAAVTLVLRQVVGGQLSASNVEEWQKPWGDLSKLAGDVVDCAQLDADAVGSGTYAYALCACDVNGRVFTRRPFRIVAQDEIGNLAGPADQANATGVLGQMMRHVEAKERLQTAGELRVLDRYEKMIAKLEQRVEQLEGREADVLKLFEELISKKHSREVELIRAQTDAKAKGDFADKVIGLLPHAAAKFGVVPAQGDPEVQALVEELIKHQVPIDGLLASMPPQAQLYLASIIKRYIPAKPADPQPEPQKAN